MRSQNFIDQGERTLIIDRQKTHMFEIKGQPLESTELFQTERLRITEGPIQGVLGIMNIIGQNYLCCAKEAQTVGTLYGA